MFRTCSVRFEAIRLTLSVRSFHRPDSPLTLAWPPSFPSVPTSLATRLTSAPNEESWSTIALTAFPIRRCSPLTRRPSMLRTTFCDRSPRATASMTGAISVIGRIRSSMSTFMLDTRSAQAPGAPDSAMRSDIRPSRPTSLETRSISRVVLSISSTQSLKAAATLPARPERRAGSRARKSPCLSCSSAASSSSSRGSSSRCPFAEPAWTGRLRAGFGGEASFVLLPRPSMGPPCALRSSSDTARPVIDRLRVIGPCPHHEQRHVVRARSTFRVQDLLLEPAGQLARVLAGVFAERAELHALVRRRPPLGLEIDAPVGEEDEDVVLAERQSRLRENRIRQHADRRPQCAHWAHPPLSSVEQKRARMAAEAERYSHTLRRRLQDALHDRAESFAQGLGQHHPIEGTQELRGPNHQPR